jgi:hypothetical protein
MNHIVRYYWNAKTSSFTVVRPEVAEPRKLFFPPMDGEWLLKAATLPGKALAVACVIQLEAAFARKRTIPLPNKWLVRAGVNRDAKRRALLALIDAGLIRSEHRSSGGPVVTILR